LNFPSEEVIDKLWRISKSMRALPIILFAIFISITTHGQQQTIIDSLLHELSQVKNDTVKTRLYKSIVDRYSMNNPDAAFRYAELGMKHVKTMNWGKGIAVFQMIIGTLESEKGNYQLAVERFSEAYTFHFSNKDFYNAASTLNNWGSAYQRQSVYDKATEKYFEALKLAESIPNNYLIASCMSNIGKVYSGQRDFDKALEYDFKALEIQSKDANNDGMADTYVSIANTYIQKKDTVHARQYYEDALTQYTKAGNNIGVASVYTNMSNLFIDNKSVLDYRLKAQKIWDEVSPAHSISIVNQGNIVLTYIDIIRHPKQYPIHISRKELLQKAETYVHRAILYSIESQDKGNYAFLVGVRSELESEKGNFKKAYTDANLFHSLKDSIYSQESKNKIATIQGAREVALRDKEIELNKLALATQRKQNIALTIGLGFVLIIGALLYRQNQIRKKTNAELVHLNSQLDDANKVKAKFFAILSHDLRSPLARLINFLHLQKEAPDLLTGEQAAVHQQKIMTSAEALLENMETVLLWGKGQMVNFKPIKKKIRVGNLFKQLNDAFKGYEKVELFFSDSEKTEITTDENYLFTIMHNLSVNAIKALDGTNNASITWKAEKDNNGKIILSITDNGPGLSKDQSDRLLNEREITDNKNGFGFHIVRDLAKTIHCTISIKSQAAKGTSFRLLFDE
jgi:signal transduction histidine kinase